MQRPEMSEMTRDVAIIGVCQTRYETNKRSQSLAEVIFEAASGALADAGLSVTDIDGVVLAADDLIDGISISSMVTGPPAGCSLKDEVRISDDGSFAVALAYSRLVSEHQDTCLVVSWSKCSQNDLSSITNLIFDPFYYRFVGLNHVTSHAVQAMRYMCKYGVTEEQAAKVVVKNRMNAHGNPYAHLRESVTVDDVLNSRTLSWPLKQLDLPPLSDGACALVLAAPGRVKMDNPYAWIRAISWINDSYYMGDRELADLVSLNLAARRAYSMAGISDPLKQLDVAEVHEVTSFHELMIYEALGLCGPGEGKEFIESAMSSTGGDLPINPSGGCLSSNPYTAVGLVRVVEAALQVAGRAGKHQVRAANIALAHGMSGVCGQNHCVIIVSR